MTLIELMVALAIGAFLMLGALTVFMQSRTSFRVNENLSRLQENARFALETMEPDIRMAHYWGLTPRTYLIQGRAAPHEAAGIGTHPCGNNWSLNLNEAVEGTNNTYSWPVGCGNAPPGGARPNADTLTVRRASEDAVAAPVANVLYIQSARAQLGQIFAGAALPAGFNAATSETHRLIVNGYYVANSSATGVPSLRRKVFHTAPTAVGAMAPADEEVLIGVEDMQIEFGIDTDVPGTPVAPNPDRGAVDRWVNPDDPVIDPTNAGFNPNAEILAVRVWLRLRSERVENGLIDNTDYEYADQDFGTLGADGFRRLLVSKTIYIRNARPAL
jgi:type IV pilus assembly protein PilW